MDGIDRSGCANVLKVCGVPFPANLHRTIHPDPPVFVSKKPTNITLTGQSGNLKASRYCSFRNFINDMMNGIVGVVTCMAASTAAVTDATRSHAQESVSIHKYSEAQVNSVRQEVR